MRVDQLRMLGDNLLVVPLVEQVTHGGILIPGDAQARRSDRGRVVLLGPGATIAEMALRVGDVIVVEDFVGSGVPIDVDGVKHLIFGADEVQAVLSCE